LSQAISGGGGIIKSGAGPMVLSAVNSFTGGLTINQGPAIITGSTGNVGVNTGGVLSGTGNGTTTGKATNVVLAGGSIRPGASAADGNVGTLAMSSLNALSGDIRPDIANARSYDR